MSVVAEMKGLVRGTVDTLKHIAVGGQGDLKVSHFLPRYAQLVAENRVWRVQEATATASVVALPTTAALFTIQNNEPHDGLWYVILAIYAVEAANAAAIDKASIAVNVQMAESPANAIAQDIARTSVKPMLSTGGAYGGNVVVDTGVTITDDLWFPIAPGSSTAVASATGGSIFSLLDGLIVLPPRGVLATASLATSTSNTTRKGLIWAEVPKSYLKG